MTGLARRLSRVSHSLPPLRSTADEEEEIIASAAARDVSPAVIRARRGAFERDLAVYDPAWSLGQKVLAWAADHGIPADEIRALVRSRVGERYDQSAGGRRR